MKERKKKLKKNNVLDLFAGCGGFSKGFEQAGFNIVAANDISKYAGETYKKNHPNAKFFLGDIRDLSVQKQIISYMKEKGCEVIIGGPPCQAYSIAGKRDPNDPRGDLFEEYAKIIGKLQPKIFVMENVKGILTIRHNGVLITDKIVAKFNSLNYDVKFKLLNSANFGVPQKRERIIFIGKKYGEISYPQPTHSEKGEEGLKKWVSVREAIGDLENKENIASHIFTKHGKDFLEKIKNTPIGNSVLGNYSDAFFRCDPDLPSRTVKGNHGSVFVHYKDHRVMTPRELARLQGFPDNFLFEGSKSEQLIQIGNAVPIQLARAVGMHIKKLL